MITATGWTLQQLDSTPWPDIRDLLDYWTTHPPVHELLRAFMGVEDEEDEQEMDRRPFTLDELRAMAAKR